MANSTSARLQLVRDAIDAILTNGAVSSYEINGRQLTTYSLDQLMRLEKYLVRQLNNERGDTMQNFVRFGDVN